MNRDELAELLSGYLDGELSEHDAATVERALQEDEGARILLEELRQTVHIVGALPRHDAPASIAEDIAAHLERSDLLGEPDAFEPVAGPKGRSPWSALLSMAAGLAVVATGVLWYTYDPGAEGFRQTVVSNQRKGDDDLRAVPTELAKEKSGVLRKMALSPRTSFAEKSALNEEASRSSSDRKERRSTRLARKGRAPGSSVATNVGVGLPAVPVGAVYRLDEAKLLAAAKVEQLVAADGKVSHLRGHAFNNEELQLRIPAVDGEETESLARWLVSTFASRSVVDAATSKDETPLAEISKNGFFLQGASGVNFDDPRQEQILVYVSVSDRDALLDELEKRSGIGKNVELQYGSLGFSGLARARAALAGRVGSEREELDSDAKDRDEVYSATPTRSSPDDSSPEPGFGLAGLLDMVQVLANAGDQGTGHEEFEAKEPDRMAGAATDSSEPPPDAEAATFAERPPSERGAEDSGTRRNFAAWREKSVAGKDRFASGSLVDYRLKDLDTSRASRLQERRSARRGRKFVMDEATRSRDAFHSLSQRKSEAEPERFVTLVFQFVPGRPVKAKASKRTSGMRDMKRKSPDGRSPNRPKNGKKDNPIHQ